MRLKRTATWPVVALLLLVFAAYHNSFFGPFVFDDAPAIVDNASIHRLSLATLLPPPDQGQTVGGRPVVNLTLALSYALGGTNPTGYHIFNLLVHACSACVLYGLIRRTLLSPKIAPQFSGSATELAFAVAAIWAVHPLLTESVTYIVQRAESLMGLLYLLALYASMRASEIERVVPRAPGLVLGSVANRCTKDNAYLWSAVAIAACLLGMATKEAMVTAPVVVLLYHRAFLADSWRDVWRRRWPLHAALLSTWLLLAWLVHTTAGRGGTAGIGVGDSSWEYLLVECRAIVHYILLTLWPSALAFDYGMHHDTTVIAALPFAILLLTLLMAAVVAWRRRPALGFLGIAFFALLAPSSSIVPIAVQPIAEHRMYLPAAVLVTLAVIAGFWCYKRAARWVVVVMIGALATLTIARNATYRSEAALWNDTVAKQPQNARAYGQLADTLAASGRPEAALPYYRKALELEISAVRQGGRTILTDLLIDTGNALLALGRSDEALGIYRQAIQHDDTSKTAHYNLGSALMTSGRLEESAAELEAAIQLDPNYTSARTNLGSVRLQQQRPADALANFEAALRLNPSAKTYANLGIALNQLGRRAEAIAAFGRALDDDPKFVPALELLAEALWAEHKRDDARAVLERILVIDSENARAHELRAEWAAP